MKISAKEVALGFHQQQDQVVRRRLTDEHELDVFLVGDTISNLIALEIRSLPAGIGLPDVDVGDVIDIEFLVDDGTLKIKLLANDYSDIFYVLVDDLVGSIIDNPGLVEGAKALMIRLRRWERLLESSTRGLTKSAQRGLFGELTVLLQLLSSAADSQQVLNAWMGPDGGTRDFEFGATGIEVKTTSAKGLLTVRISSERQLEVIAVNRLLLWCVSIERSDNGVELNSKVQEVEALISADLDLLEVFRSKLIRVGYVEVDKHRYSTRFFVRDEYVYDIKEGFPRIVSEDIPNNVFDVAYSIDVEACEKWRVSKNSVLGQL
jgi:hypothetical protein